MNIASAVILCTIVGAVGAIILVAAAKFMAVEEDPRIEEVASCLAGANCGGCGYAGCADYAKAVVMDGVACDKCAPGGPKAAAAIAKIMGGLKYQNLKTFFAIYHQKNVYFICFFVDFVQTPYYFMVFQNFHFGVFAFFAKKMA